MNKLPAPGFTLVLPDIAFGDTPVLAAQSITVPARGITAVLGASGVGKSTILRLLAGLHPLPAGGQIRTTDGVPLAGRVSWMAQQSLLLPWRTVLQNVTLGSAVRGETIDLRAAQDLLAQVGLTEQMQRYPAELSGGQQQRAALARTLIENRPVVLMDEPFSALDAPTRFRLQTLALGLLRHRTVVLVTHDPAEALRIADHILVLRGRPAVAQALALPTSATPRSFETIAAAQAALLAELEAA